LRGARSSRPPPAGRAGKRGAQPLGLPPSVYTTTRNPSMIRTITAAAMTMIHPIMVVPYGDEMPRGGETPPVDAGTLGTSAGATGAGAGDAGGLAGTVSPNIGAGSAATAAPSVVGDGNGVSLTGWGPGTTGVSAGSGVVTIGFGSGLVSGAMLVSITTPPLLTERPTLARGV
jgi:hypothetical protein